MRRCCSLTRIQRTITRIYVILCVYVYAFQCPCMMNHVFCLSLCLGMLLSFLPGLELCSPFLYMYTYKSVEGISACDKHRGEGMYTHAYMHILIHTHILYDIYNAYTPTCIYTHTNRKTYVHISVHTYKQTHIHVHTRTYIHTCTLKQICTFMCTHKHTREQTCIQVPHTNK